MKGNTTLLRVMPIFSFLLGLVIWEIVGRSGISSLFPPFSKVLVAWVQLMQDPKTFKDLLSSMKTLFIGYGLAVAVGIPLGVFMGYFKKVDESIGVIINALQGAPMIAFVPVFMILFGTGPQVQISVVFFFAFFVIAVGADTGAKEVDYRLIEMAKSFQASNLTIFRRIIIPSSMRYIFSGLYMGMVRSIQGLVTAEMLVTLKGIGAEVMYYGQSFLMDYLFATIINILILAIVLGGLVRLASDYILNKINQGGITNA